MATWFTEFARHRAGVITVARCNGEESEFPRWLTCDFEEFMSYLAKCEREVGIVWARDDAYCPVRRGKRANFV